MEKYIQKSPSLVTKIDIGLMHTALFENSLKAAVVFGLSSDPLGQKSPVGAVKFATEEIERRLGCSPPREHCDQ